MPMSKPTYEELEERIRQLQALIAPIARFPLAWGLTKRESELLAALITRKQVSREQLVAALYANSTGEEDIRIVDQYVMRTRRKLEVVHGDKAKIISVYGFGYTVDEEYRQMLRAYIEKV